MLCGIQMQPWRRGEGTISYKRMKIESQQGKPPAQTRTWGANVGPGWPGPGYRGQRPSKPFPSRLAVRRARVSVGGSLLLAHARPLIPGLHLITGPAGRSFYSSSVNAVAMDGSLTPGTQEL